MLSGISIVGVMVGVATLVVALSIMNGFKKALLEKMVGANAHAVVYHIGGKFDNYEEARGKLISIPEVESAAPMVLGEAILSAGNRVAGVGVKGVDLRFPRHYRGIERAKVGERGDIRRLRAPSAAELPGIAIGVDLADKLEVKVGDVVTLISPLTFFGLRGSGGASRRDFRVALIYKLGLHQYDAKFCFIEFGEAQKFFKLEGSASGLEFFVRDFERIKTVREKVGAVLGGFPYRIQDWRQQNYPIFKALEQNKKALTIILLCIIFVASLNIAGTLILMVLEKSREIAILRTLGAKKRGIMSIFINYGLYIGTMGTLLGLGLGLLICAGLNQVGIKLDASIYFISEIPVEIVPWEWAAVAGAAVMISFLATIYPAIQAARQKPVQILRYN